MDNNYSLKEVLNMINLSKYMEVDGEVASIVIKPKNTSERTISIGTKGSNNATSFTFSFSDGKAFDETILPIMLREFLNNDERLSWTKTGGENGTVRELITTVSGNEFLLETDNPNIHEIMEHIVEKPSYYDDKFDKDDEAVDKILRYLRERFKPRVCLDKLPPNLKREMISIVSSAYQASGGRNIKNEELIGYIEHVKDNISKEAYGLFIKDFNENDFLIVRDIKDYLKNEALFDNYLDEEPYISLKETGLKLVEDGYFSIANNFPRKVTLSDLKDDNLKELITSKYKFRYKFLQDEENTYERLEDLKTVENIRKFSKYLVKATRLRIQKDAINREDFKEITSEYPHNDLDSLIKAIKLYKNGKTPTDYISLSIEESDNYTVKLSLVKGNAKDTNTFSFDKEDSFLSSILPNILNTFLDGDTLKSVNSSSSISTFTTGIGNTISGSAILLSELETSITDYQEYEKLAGEEKEGTITPYGEARKEELAEKDERIGELSELDTALADNNVTPSEYKQEKTNIISDLKKIKYATTQVETVRDNSELTFDIPERKGNLESNLAALASYFRKEILKEKGLLSSSGLKEMLNLKFQSKEVNEIEIAKERLLKKEITKEQFDEIHEYYKNLLVGELKKSVGNNSMISLPAKPVVVVKPYVTKENNTFRAMKSLIGRYKVLLSDGVLNVYDRNNNTQYETSDEEKKLIEFANLWCSLVGIMPSKDDVSLGSVYAYNDDNEKLFNIVEAKILEHINTGKSVDIDAIKIECFDNGIPSCDKIIDRLFQSSDHVAYVVDFFKSMKDVDTSKYIVVRREPSIIRPQVEANDSEEEINKMLATYGAACNSANDTYNASMKIFVPRDNDTNCQVIVTIGKTFNERILYTGVFSKDYIVKEQLNGIIDKFININGLEDSKSYEVPSTTKAGIILTGKKSNVLQFTNIPLEDVLVITAKVNEYKKALEERDKVKSLGTIYGQKAA